MANKDDIARLAKQLLSECLVFKQPRMEQIVKSLDAYQNKVPLAPKGYKMIPIPVMSGYVSTLLAKIDDPVRLRFQGTKQADWLAAQRLTSLWEIDKSEQKANYNQVDRWVKKNAIFSGIGAYKVYSESDPEYAHHLEPIDYFDLIFEPTGGGDIQKHLYCGQQNIYRTKSELQAGADEGRYDANKVAEIVNMTEEKRLAIDQNTEQLKQSRYRIINLDPKNTVSQGDSVYNMAEMYLRYKDGQDWYVFFEQQTGIWVNCVPLKEKFKSGRRPIVVWQIDEDANTLLCKAPADDILPIHDAIRICINDALNNVTKRTYAQRAFDKDMVIDAAMLRFSKDGIIPMDTKNGTRALSSGIFTFDTPDTTQISLNIVTFLDNFLGTKTGITPATQGTSDDEKVGIYYGNMQQVADRIGLTNKSYKKCHTDIGIRYIDGVREHLTDKVAVKILGQTDVEYCVKDDAEPDYDIIVESSTEAERVREITVKQKREILSAISGNQTLVGLVNPKKVLEELLLTGGWDMGEVKEFMDVDFYGQKKVLSLAASAAQSIKENKKPNDYKQADGLFVEHFAQTCDELNLNPKQKTIAEDYARRHLEYAKENIMRKALLDVQKKEMEAMNQIPLIPNMQPQPAQPALMPIKPQEMPMEGQEMGIEANV